ncbi:NUMOD4 domain-containing protein [Mycolicibacterium porcinum]|uniref:NUMOD4 domain-containing protein n=1 Tax=Mycolicibacterium porcinum TaxID=39693 RepID=UPI0009F4498C|nr:NUMOD4 domain-containing protein [Mycolicibacterium porcinum]
MNVTVKTKPFGTHFNKRSGKWWVRITVKGVPHFVGQYRTAELAVHARKAWLRAHGIQSPAYEADKPQEWRPVPRFPDRFEVSDKGLIRSKPTARAAGQIRKLQRDRDGYLKIRVRLGGGKYGNLYVHRAVAEAYIPNPLKKPVVNHLDSNPGNNSVENLEWATVLENVRHSVENGHHVSQSYAA